MPGRSRKRSFGFSGSGLKGIAMCTMACDHIAAILLPVLWNGRLLEQADVVRSVYLCMRMIGRLAFPIFAFALTEGFFHTGNKRKYLLRLGVFALLSEIPFDWAITGKVVNIYAQNVIFTLFIGALSMFFIEKWEKKPIVQGLTAIAGCLLAQLIRTDYGAMGILLILGFYLLHNYKKEQLLAGAVIMVCMANRWWENTYLLSLLLIYAYNGERGQGGKLFGYYFYPLHLALLAGIRSLL